MKKEEKALIIDKIQESFAKSSIGILTDYRGLKTHELVDIRHKLRDAGGKYEIVKNTLTRFAAEKAGVGQINNLLIGMMAIAFGFRDAKELAVALTDYIRSSKSTLSIKGGFLGNRVLTPADIQTLTTLPSREVLLAMVMGQLQSPIVILMRQLNAPIQGLANVLQARMKQLEGG